MDLNKKLEELKPYQLNCNVFDVYSYNGLTMQDLLCQFFTKINECITVSNETIDLAKWLVNEGLEIEVVKKLMIWLEDGTLENIINVNLFNTLNDKINGLSSQLEHIVNYKIDSIDNLTSYNYRIGDVIEILGYYTKGDSIKHYRVISNVNDGSGILVNNDLYANIKHDGYVNVAWFGVICKNSTDFKNNEMQSFLDYIKTGLANDFDLGCNNIYVNKPLSLVFSKTGGGFSITSNGAVIISTINEAKPALQIGIYSTDYVSLSNVKIKNLELKANGSQTDGLKLFTKGRQDHAFWNSLFENIKVSVNKGKGISIYNGVFECQFNSLRIDHKRKAKELEDGILLTTNDIGLYLANEPDNNIISSLKFDYVNIWGGYHSIKTEGLNGRYSPDFSCNECHVFDSKMEALLLQNQQHYNYLKKLHMEFIGTSENPVWGVKWIGYGVIDGVEGGSDGLLGFVRVHNGYANVMRVNNLAKPLALHSTSKGYLFTHTENGGNIETDCELSNIHIPDYCTGNLICNVNGRKATIKLTGNSKRIDIVLNTENGITCTKNEGIDNNATYTNFNTYGIYGGKTNITNMDFSNNSSVIRYDLGYGVQNNVKLGFYGKNPIQKPVVQGGDGGNLALRQLLSALSLLGLIDNSTSQG